jgi:hypothetical protein
MIWQLRPNSEQRAGIILTWRSCDSFRTSNVRARLHRALPFVYGGIALLVPLLKATGRSKTCIKTKMDQIAKAKDFR